MSNAYCYWDRCAYCQSILLVNWCEIYLFSGNGTVLDDNDKYDFFFFSFFRFIHILFVGWNRWAQALRFNKFIDVCVEHWNLFIHRNNISLNQSTMVCRPVFPLNQIFARIPLFSGLKFRAYVIVSDIL